MARVEVIAVLPEGTEQADIETTLAELENAAPVGTEIRYTKDGRNWQLVHAGKETSIPMGGASDSAADAKAKGKSKS